MKSELRDFSNGDWDGSGSSNVIVVIRIAYVCPFVSIYAKKIYISLSKGLLSHDEMHASIHMLTTPPIRHLSAHAQFFGGVHVFTFSF
jgi:hypothetical protein